MSERDSLPRLRTLGQELPFLISLAALFGNGWLWIDYRFALFVVGFVLCLRLLVQAALAAVAAPRVWVIENRAEEADNVTP